MVQPAAFLSYVHADDQHEGGRLAVIQERLSEEVQFQTGLDFLIFRDRKDIKWGQNWRERITHSLSHVTFFIPVITPRYFRSEACLEELRTFLGREQELGRGDMVLPIYYVTCEQLEHRDRYARDDLAQAIADHQYADWRPLRHEPIDSPEIGRRIADLASQIRDALTRVEAIPMEPSGGAALPSAEPSGEAPDVAEDGEAPSVGWRLVALRAPESKAETIIRGIDLVADEVGRTLGPHARPAVLQGSDGRSRITADPAMIAPAITPENQYERAGADLVKDLVKATRELARDGSAIATVLAQRMVREAEHEISAGANPMVLKRGIEKATELAVEAIKNQAKDVETIDEVAHTASVSAGDPEIGEVIARAMDTVGKDGAITVEESNTFGIELELVEGMRFETGLPSAYLATDPERMEAVLDDPYILVANQNISAVKDLLPVLERILQAGRPLVVIAENVEGEAMATLIVNKVRGTFRSVAVKAPGFGDRRKAILQDIAILTGGQVISEEVGLKLENVGLDLLGRARRVVVTKDETTIIEGWGDPEQIKGRVNQIRAEIENTDSGYDREKLQERLAKLMGGVGVIKVGAATEVELQDRKERIEGALSATRAAVEEGIVPGGGVALLRAEAALGRSQTAGAGEAVGVEIVRRALDEPLRRIAANGGYPEDEIVREVRRKPGSWGFDVRRGEYIEMFKAGIIDPAQVIRSALEGATGMTQRYLMIV
jgi:chaperonin GroEL